jgi:hypothetical protein
MKKRDDRRTIDIGPKFNQVSNWRHWYDSGFFHTRDEALGALRLADQQYLDGMGVSRDQWIGLSEVEFFSWIKTGSLPKDEQWIRNRKKNG